MRSYGLSEAERFAALKRCPRCGETKPAATGFYRTVVKGRAYPSAHCRDCSKRQLAEHGRRVTAARSRAVQERKRALGERLRRSDAGWPADEELVALMAESGSFEAVARACDRSRGSLRDFLRSRPMLDARMREHMREPYSPEIALARRREAGRRHSRQKRAGGPTALEYAEIVLADPCSYCGASAEHADHIEPLAHGGDGAWHNLTAACARCNQTKHKRPLLTFLLARREVSESGQSA